MSRHLSMDDAAAALGVSRKTIQRRLKSGSLSGTFDGRRWLVEIPDQVIDPDNGAESRSHGGMSETPASDPDMSETPPVAELQRQIADLQAERDWLRQHIDQLTVLNAQLTARLLPGPSMGPPGSGAPPPVVDEPPRRRWRWPWRR